MPTLTLREIVELTEGTLQGNPDHLISGVESLEAATSSEAAFLDNPRYSGQLQHSKAGVILIPSSMTPPKEGNFILVSNPTVAFQALIHAFIPKTSSGFKGIHPTSVIHPSVKLGNNVTIAPHVVIDEGAIIGDGCHLYPFVSIGAKVVLGAHCTLHAHVVIESNVILHNRVVIQAGAVIGSSGFGYATNERGEHTSLEQLGNVVLEDDVEIGANTTIDRARFKSTRIGRGTKVDNLVQIAHQVVLGENNLIVSQVGIAGSTKTGKNVVMGGQVGVVGHITIGDQVILAARSAVSKSILEKGIYSGAPAIPIRAFNEQLVLIRNLKTLLKKTPI